MSKLKSNQGYRNDIEEVLANEEFSKSIITFNSIEDDGTMDPEQRLKEKRYDFNK
jgi:hypothetical protein